MPAGAGDDGTLCRLRAFLPAARRLPVRAVRRQGLSETNPTGCGGKSPAVFIVGKKMLALRRFAGGVLPRRLCRLAGVRVPAIVSFDDRRTGRVRRKVFGVRDRGRFGFFGLRPLPVSANGSLSDGMDRPRRIWIGRSGLACRCRRFFLCKNEDVRCRGRRRDFMASGGRCEPDSSSGRWGVSSMGFVFPPFRDGRPVRVGGRVAFPRQRRRPIDRRAKRFLDPVGRGGNRFRFLVPSIGGWPGVFAPEDSAVRGSACG